MTEIFLGCEPDQPDNRDFQLINSRVGKLLAVPPSLPAFGTLAPWGGPIKSQGPIGSCVGTGCSRAMETVIRGIDESSRIVLSALDLYRRMRIEGGTFPADTGGQARDALKVLCNQGIPTEEEWPYDIRRMNDEPGPDVDGWALQRRLAAYYAVDMSNPIDGIRAAITDRSPLVMSWPVYGGLLGPRLSPGAVLLDPGSDPFIGGHLTQIEGYDDASQLVLIANSWSESWGNHGRFYMPYEMVQKSWGIWALCGVR